VEQTQTLIARAAAGDRTARDRLLAGVADHALRIAYRILGDREEALEATQEVLLRVHRALGRIDPERPLNPYVRRIAVNVCRDRMSAAGKRRRREIDGDGPEPAAAGPSAEQVAERQQRIESVRSCLADLSPRERTAFVLRHVDGLLAVEVAGLMGCSASTVRGHCHAARKKLRQRMRDLHPEWLEDDR